MLGKRIGQYRITREIGRGGMGIVYEAVHERIGQRVAVKTLAGPRAGDPRARERFFREARACVLIDHEGVPAVFDFGDLDDGTPYILMELLKGDSLRARLRRCGSDGLPALAALRIARQLGSALCAAHARGISHRDMKPENVILVADADAPGGDRAKLLDFGIASLRESGSDPSVGNPRVLGTPAYMPPEQCLGQPVAEGGRGDVYSLGCVLYEMLCGQPPFLGESDELLRRQIFESPVPPRQRVPAISERIDALALRMLAKPALERPAMIEVVQELDVELGVRVPDSPQTPMPRPLAPMLRGAATVDDMDAGARYLSEESRGETVLPAALLRGSTREARVERSARAASMRARGGSQRRKNGLWLGAAAAGAAAVIAGLFGVQRLLPRPPVHAVRLPGATFTMGSSAEEIDAAFFFCQRLERDEICNRSVFEREQPLRTVTLSPYAMDATEVTNERFAAWLNQQRGLRTVYDETRHTRWVFDGDVPLVDLYPSFPTYGLRREADGRFLPVEGYAARPVTQVTWLAASRYCAAHGQRLPTEAEWEHAARPRPGDRFPWGSDLPRCDGVVFGRLRDQECAGRQAEPAPVGSSWQDRTPQGIHDLAGNVAEWVQDPFAERYPDCGGTCTDPVVPNNENAGASKGPILRVFRGGDWAQVAVILRSAGRGRWSQSEALQNVGFRCVSPM